MQVRRPRARDEEGEVELPSWRQFAAEDPLHQRALEQMVIGVSTRKYARSLEDVPDEVRSRGTSRSAVSRRFKLATQKQLGALLHRDLAGLGIVTILIDGIHIDEHVVLIAMGVDEAGKKHVLGLWEGATDRTRQAMARRRDDPPLGRRRRHRAISELSCTARPQGHQALGRRPTRERCPPRRQG